MCKFLSRVATITKTTNDKYTISTTKDKVTRGKMKKREAATPPHIGTQPGMHSVNRGNMCSEWTGMSKFGMPGTARESRDARANWTQIDFPNLWVSEPKTVGRLR